MLTALKTQYFLVPSGVWTCSMVPSSVTSGVRVPEKKKKLYEILLKLEWKSSAKFHNFLQNFQGSTRHSSPHKISEDTANFGIGLSNMDVFHENLKKCFGIKCIFLIS